MFLETCNGSSHSVTGLTKVDIAAGVHIGKGAFSDCSSLFQVILHEGVTVDQEPFKFIKNLMCIVIPDDFPKNIFPKGSTILTHTEYAKINDFCSNHNGLKDVEWTQDKIDIYHLCLSGNDIAQRDFTALSHLPISIILDVISVYYDQSNHAEQSKQLLVWAIDGDFVRTCGDVDVAEMLRIARDRFVCMEPMSREDCHALEQISKYRSTLLQLLLHLVHLVQRTLVPYLYLDEPGSGEFDVRVISGYEIESAAFSR